MIENSSGSLGAVGRGAHFSLANSLLILWGQKNLRVGIHVVLSDLVAVHVGGLEEVVAAPDHPNQVSLDGEEKDKA